MYANGSRVRIPHRTATVFALLTALPLLTCRKGGKGVA